VIGEREQLMVERAIGSVHVGGDGRTPLSWAGTRRTECIGCPRQAFTSTARPFVRPVHLEAGQVVGPRNHQPASTSWLDFGGCTTRASLSPFVSTVDALVKVSFFGVHPLSDPRDCGVRIGFGVPFEGARQGQLASDGVNPKDRSPVLAWGLCPDWNSYSMARHEPVGGSRTA